MKQSLTIAFYCSSLSWGGLEMNVYKRALWMSQRGHQVYLFCVENAPIHKHAKDVELVLVERNKKGLDLKNTRKLKKVILNKNVDVLWFVDKRDLTLMSTTKLMLSKRIKLLYQQCMQIGVNKREFWHTLRFNRIDFWIAPLHYLKAQVEEKTRFPAERVHVIHQGLEMDQFVNSIPSRKQARSYFNLKDEDLVIGMIGRIDVAKAPKFVMDVVVQLQKDYPQLKMLMVGNKTEGEWEDYYNDIVQEIEKNHQDKSIQLFPFMREVAYFYAAVDVFVMASKNETYGMVTIESMICGNKIVGTNAAGTKELLDNENRGYYFNWMDEKSLKKALQTVLEESEKAEKKAQEAKSYARKAFSHIHELEQIEQLIS